MDFQIDITNSCKVSEAIMGFQRGASHPLAGFSGTASLSRRPQTAKLPLPSKAEGGVRKATAFRGAANKTVAPLYSLQAISPLKCAGGTF